RTVLCLRRLPDDTKPRRESALALERRRHMTLRVLGPLYGSRRGFCREVAGEIKRGCALAGSLIAAVVAMISLVPVPAAVQASAPTRWSPPRLADGQPDLQ